MPDLLPRLLIQLHNSGVYYKLLSWSVMIRMHCQYALSPRVSRTGCPTSTTTCRKPELLPLTNFSMNRNKLFVITLPHIPFLAERKREIGVYAAGALVGSLRP